MNEQVNSLSVVQIVPPSNPRPNSAHLAMGTKVLLSDGSELSGVTSIMLSASAGGVWEATITVLPQSVLPVQASASFVVADVASLTDESRHYAKVSDE